MEPVRLRAKSLQSCPTLFDPVECNLPGSSLHGVLQARLLEWAATPSFRGLPHPGIEPTSPMFPMLAGGSSTPSTTWEAHGDSVEVP